MYLFFFLIIAGLPLYAVLKPSDRFSEAASPDQPDLIDLPYEIEASTNA